MDIYDGYVAWKFVWICLDMTYPLRSQQQGSWRPANPARRAPLFAPGSLLPEPGDGRCQRRKSRYRRRHQGLEGRTTRTRPRRRHFAAATATAAATAEDCRCAGVGAVTLAICLGYVRNFAWQQFPRNCCHTIL